MHDILHTVLHTLEHSLISLPFLFAAYLLIEFIEHRHSEKFVALLQKFGKAGSVIGAILGVVPQCGFSVVAANLYSSRVISAGTLIAVFLATSDEAIPILLASPDGFSKLLPLIGGKVLLAILVGFVIDKLNLFDITKEELDIVKEEHSGCHTEGKHGLLKSAFIHTAKIFAFVFVVSLGLEICIEALGEQAFRDFMLSESALQPLVAGIVGLIPNCTSSILLAQLYAEGALSFGAAFAGLSVASGAGLLVLFRTDVDKIECVSLIGFIFVASVVAGTILQYVL